MLETSKKSLSEWEKLPYAELAETITDKDVRALLKDCISMRTMLLKILNEDSNVFVVKYQKAIRDMFQGPVE